MPTPNAARVRPRGSIGPPRASLAPFARWRRPRAAALHAAAGADACRGALVHGVGDWRLRELAASLRAPLAAEGFRDELVARTFALVREAAWRTVGQRHFDVQLVGGCVLLDGHDRRDGDRRGQDADRDAAGLRRGARGHAGARRHRQRLPGAARRRVDGADLPGARAIGGRRRARHGRGRAARGLRLRHHLLHQQGARLRLPARPPRARRPAPIACSSSSNSWAARTLVPAGSCCAGCTIAIVDEADSVLVDEARTPLIISARD